MKFEGEHIPAESLPIPTGWRILVGMLKVENTTEGGIVLTTKTVEEKEYLRYMAKVLAVGSSAYIQPRFQGEIPVTEKTPKPWVNVGDVILIRQYAGQNISCLHDGEPQDLRLLNDDEVLAVIPDVTVIDS